MGTSVKFVLRIVAGAAIGGGVGLGADILLSIGGWWIWGLCAGAIAGALISFLAEPVQGPSPAVVRKRRGR